MHEDLDVVNNNMTPVRFQLEIALRCDFADIFEVKSGRYRAPGPNHHGVVPMHQHLCTTYRNGDFSRAVTISPARSPTKAVYANGRLSFEVGLKRARHGIAASSIRWQTATGNLLRRLTASSTATSRDTAEAMADWLKNVVRSRPATRNSIVCFARRLRTWLRSACRWQARITWFSCLPPASLGS